jgi:hypothetical protein
MKNFFNVTYKDNSESYSGRFSVDNIYLDIEIDNYDLRQAINLFVKDFVNEFDYWNKIADTDLNEKALEIKNKFMEYNYTYSKLKEMVLS